MLNYLNELKNLKKQNNMKRFIFILAMMFLLLSCKKSEAQLDFVTEYWLAQNFTPKSGITPGTNNSLWMDCDQVLARYKVTISGVTSTGNRLPSESQITSNIEYVTCGELIGNSTYEDGTTTYTYDIDFGAYNGLRVYNYQNSSAPDKIDIYQNDILRASTGSLVSYGNIKGAFPETWGPVTSLPLYFKYDVSNGRYGQVKITTRDSYKNWRYCFDCNSLCNLNSTYSHANRNYVYAYELNYGGNYTLKISQAGDFRNLEYSILRDNSVVTLGTITSNPEYVPVNLQYGGNYYICCRAVDGYNVNQSNTTSITLYGCGSKPSTSITSIFNITPTTANITYTVDSDCTISRAICYSSTNTNPTTSDNHTSYTTETGNSTIQLTGLTPSTTYYLRSVAATASGTTYSTATSFTTQAAQPYTGIIDLSVTYQEDPQYYDVTFTATSQSTVQMNTTVYLAYIDPDYGGSIYNTVVIPTGSTSASVIVRYYRNTQYDVSCDFDSSYSVDFTYGTHPVYVTIPSL